MNFTVTFVLTMVGVTAALSTGNDTLAVVGCLLTIVILLLAIIEVLLNIRLHLVKMEYTNALKQKESIQAYKETVR